MLFFGTSLDAVVRPVSPSSEVYSIIGNLLGVNLALGITGIKTPKTVMRWAGRS